MKKVTFEEMLESMSARLHLIEAENESLKMDAQESRAIANQACWKTHSSWFSNSIRSVQHRPKDDRDSRYSLTGNALAWYNPYLESHIFMSRKSILLRLCGFVPQLTADLDWNDSALRAQFYFGLSYEIKDALVHFDTPSTLSLAIQQAIKVDNRLYERRLERTEVRGVTPYSSPNRFFPPTRPQPPTPRTSNTSWNQTLRRPPPPSPMVVPPPRSSNDMDIDFARRGPLTSEERQQRMNRGLCLVCDAAHYPLHPHSSAISTLSNISNPIHCQPFDSCLHISSLSSLNKLLLPGTLRIGPSTHVDTFFVDCGADDLFVDSKLAADLHIPLVKLSTPIQLRLADGDSSSVISHRTVPLQLHIGSHVETASFYVTNLCHGIILGYSWLERHNPRVNWVSRLVDFDSPYCMENCCVGSSRIQELGKPPDTNKCFPPTVVSDTSKSLAQLNPISGDCSLASILSLDSIQEGVYPFVEASPLSESGVPADILSQFESVFSKDLAETLPPHRDFDCSIELIPGSVPAYGKIYHLTREEDTQKDKLRLCMDYRGLNKNTIKDRNPIPLISEMLRTLSTGKVFTTLDLRGAYNLLRIKKGDEPKTSFITKYGQFEFLVMPFGLANAPAQFQRMMNALFRDVVGKHVLVYLDDIVIYSDTMDKHVKQVQSVLGVLRDNGLYCKAEKCHFYQTEIKYLGYIISSNGIRMDPSKISAVQEWPTPRKVRDLQVFLGFTNFYRSYQRLFQHDVPSD
ncbi:hypothetical protein BSLG_009166 [Batrachochytrium salamandrivorans]|nr:hypothetical protein BSLG_009166 [Batrachochytrium salamandrivorans]